MNLRLTFASLFPMAISFTSVAQNEIHHDTLLIKEADSLEYRIFEKVDIEAKFPGGDMAWRKFLERNLRGDVAAENGAPSGIYTVWVQFIVDKEGKIADVKALTNNGYGMEQEVTRIIKICPLWQPASQNGRKVKAYRKQPVTFMIEDEGFEITSQEEYVFFMGMDNPITIKADKVKPEDLEVTLSEGTLIPKGNGNYIVRVNKPGRVILQLFNRKHKNIGAASFEVKQKNQSSPSQPPTLKG